MEKVKPANRPTHSELVSLGVRWLRSRRRSVVFGEFRTNSSHEQPDCIGWDSYGWSILVECKASRSDFLRDKKKISRRLHLYALGQERYYLCKAGLIGLDEVPDGWGLLYTNGRRVYVVVKAKRGLGDTKTSVYDIERTRHELPYLLAFVRGVFGMSKPYRSQVGRAVDLASMVGAGPFVLEVAAALKAKGEPRLDAPPNLFPMVSRSDGG